MWNDATYMMARPHSRPARADNGGMDPVPLARYARSKDGDALENAKATRAGSPPEDIITAHVCATVTRQSVASVKVCAKIGIFTRNEVFFCVKQTRAARRPRHEQHRNDVKGIMNYGRDCARDVRKDDIGSLNS